MRLDYGFLSALSGRRNWDSIKAEKQRELLYQTMLNTMQEQENRSQQEKAAAIQNYLNTASSLKVLPRGLQRIQEVDQNLRQPIVENIKKYGGDLSKYMAVEGMGDLQGYLNNLLHHPTTVREINNASNAARYQADQEAGLEEKLQLDPVTGEYGGGFAGQLVDYEKGDTDVLNYRGGFKPDKIDETVFSKIHGDKDIYKAVPVGTSDYNAMILSQLLAAGLSKENALQQLHYLDKSNRERIAQGNPLWYKAEKRPQPTSFGVGEANKLQDARYLLEQLGAATTGHPDVYQTTTEGVEDENGNFYTPEEAKEIISSEFTPDDSWIDKGRSLIGGKKYAWVDKEGNKYTEEEAQKKSAEIAKKKFKPATQVTGDALTGVPINKYSYSHYETKADGSYKNVDENGNPIATVEEKDNLIKKWKFKNGQAYIKTTQSSDNKSGTVDGEKVDNQGYMKVTDNIVTAIAKSLNIPLHSVRKALDDAKAYKSKTPETEKMAGAKGGTYKGLDEHGNPIFE